MAPHLLVKKHLTIQHLLVAQTRNKATLSIPPQNYPPLCALYVSQTYIDNKQNKLPLISVTVIIKFSKKSIDIKSLQNRLLKVCYVPPTSASLPRVSFFFSFLFFVAAAIDSTNEANKAPLSSLFSQMSMLQCDEITAIIFNNISVQQHHHELPGQGKHPFIPQKSNILRMLIGVSTIDIKSLQNRLHKVCYVHATRASFPRVSFFFSFLFCCCGH